MTKVALLALRVLVGGVFIVAGALKLREPADFATAISNYRLLPTLAPYLALSLPPTEILAGAVLLVAPTPWRRAAALAIAVMMLIFVIASSWAFARGIDVACGCFGSRSGSVTWLTLVRDLGLASAAAVLVVDPRSGDRT